MGGNHPVSTAEPGALVEVQQQILRLPRKQAWSVTARVVLAGNCVAAGCDFCLLLLKQGFAFSCTG